MRLPRNTPRFGRWSSPQTPPYLDAEDLEEHPPIEPLDVWDDDGGAPPCSAAEKPKCPKCHPRKRTLKVRVREWLEHVMDGYDIEEDDDES